MSIGKATGSATAAQKPTATNPTWTGAAQALVKAPDSLPEGYAKVLYSTDGTDWKEVVPTGTEAKKYTVYVRPFRCKLWYDYSCVVTSFCMR